jgi:outer membrane protein TolC
VKNITKILCILFISALGVFVTNAQSLQESDSQFNSHRLLIPKLTVLIDSALVNSGMVNYRILEIEAKEANIKAKRRDWTRNFGIQADTRYGTFNNFSTISGDNSSVNLASNTQQLNYNVGLYLKIPVFDIINRKSQIKRAKVEIEQARRLVKFQEDEIKESVIRYFEDLVLRQNLLKLSASNLGNAKVNMEMVEKEFRNGLLPISEYVRISDMTVRIASDYEKAKSNFLVSKKLLENITGIIIN